MTFGMHTNEPSGFVQDARGHGAIQHAMPAISTAHERGIHGDRLRKVAGLTTAAQKCASVLLLQYPGCEGKSMFVTYCVTFGFRPVIFAAGNVVKLPCTKLQMSVAGGGAGGFALGTAIKLRSDQ